MFGLDHVGNRARVHPGQNFQTFAAGSGGDTPQHRCGLVVAQGALEHFFYVVGRTQSQAGLLFNGRYKFIEHDVDRLLRQVLHLHHRSAQGLHFFGVEEADDVRGLLFTQQEHEDRRTLCAGHRRHFLAQCLRGVAVGAVVWICHGDSRPLSD